MTTAAGLWARGRWMDPVGDPGFSWSLAYRLSHGERLYRDVYFTYGPLSPYLLALWARAFGVSSLSILLLHWIPAIGAGLLLLRCARRFLSTFERLALAGMILAISVFVPGPGRLILPYYAGVVHAFVFSLAALLLLARDRPVRGAAFFAGALAGLAFCCKQEIGAAALAALLAGAFTAVEKRARSAAAALGGFAVVAVAAAGFVASSAPLDWLRERDRLWPLNPRPPAAFDLLFRSVAGLADSDWFVSLRASAWTLLAEILLAAVLGGLLARELSGRAWRRLLALGLALGVWWAIDRFPSGGSVTPIRLSVVVSFLLGVLALLSPRLEGRGSLVALAVFGGLTGLRAVFSPFLSGPYDGPAHFVATATWIILLLVFLPRLLWPPPFARAATAARGVLAAALFLSFWWDAAGDAASLRFPWKEEVSTPSGSVYLEPGRARFLRAVGNSVTRGERVLVLPEINAVDALFEVRSVSPLLHHLPGWLDGRTEGELLDRLEAAPPPVVVLFTRDTSEFGSASFGQGYGGAISEWYTRNYRVTYSSPRGKIMRLREEHGTTAVTAPSRVP